MDNKTKKTLSKVNSGKSLFSKVGKAGVSALLIVSVGMGALAPMQANAGNGILSQMWEQTKEEIKLDMKKKGELKRSNYGYELKRMQKIQNRADNRQEQQYRLQQREIVRKQRLEQREIVREQRLEQRQIAQADRAEIRREAWLQKQSDVRMLRLQKEADADARVLRQQQVDAAAAISNIQLSQQVDNFKANAADMGQTGGYTSNYVSPADYDDHKVTSKKQPPTYKSNTGAARYH